MKPVETVKAEGGRSCANCACAIEVKHPQLINKTQLLCRLNPPALVQQEQRDEEGVLISRGYSLTYAPTGPELVCFSGWRPEGTLPGNRPLSFDEFPPELKEMLSLATRAILPRTE